MKTLTFLATFFVSLWAFANPVIVPINPLPQSVAYCNQVGNTLSCTNGTQCRLDNLGAFTQVQCSNGLRCNVNSMGGMTCNDGNSCQVSGMQLQCSKRTNCQISGPSSFLCHL